MVETGGSSQDDYGNAISVDASGNSYVTGSFKGRITFPGGTSFTSACSGDIFVAKYDLNGNFLWAQQAKGPGNDSGSAISLDGAGNAYVTGLVGGGTTQFSSTQSITTGGNDLFIAKYSTHGQLLWARTAGGPGSDSLIGVKAFGASGAYVTGQFRGTAFFGPCCSPVQARRTFASPITTRTVSFNGCEKSGALKRIRASVLALIVSGELT